MVCKEKDVYFEWLAYIRREAHFSAQLDNGEIIFQDDYRAECEHNTQEVPQEPKAWERLRGYVKQNGIWIKNLWLQNLDNIVKPLPDEADGYYFKKGILGQLFSDHTRHFYIIGYLDLRTKKVKAYKYGVPELLLLETDEREVKIDDPCLIIRPGLENLKLTKTDS